MVQYCGALPTDSDIMICAFNDKSDAISRQNQIVIIWLLCFRVPNPRDRSAHLTGQGQASRIVDEARRPTGTITGQPVGAADDQCFFNDETCNG